MRCMGCRTKDPARLARRIQKRLFISGSLINAVSAFTVATYLLIIFPPDADPDWITPWTGLIGTAIYTTWASIVGGRRSRRLWWRIRSWLSAGEEPSAKQLRQLLRMPKQLALTTFALSMVSIPFFATPSIIEIGWQFGFEVAGSIALAGLTTTAAVFLSAERILRPVMGMALPAEEAPDARSLGIGPRLILTWLLCSG